MKVLGQLEMAQLEQIASTSPTPAATGRIYTDVTAPTAALPKFYNGTSWKQLAYVGDLASAYNITSLKTGNYTAVAGDYVRCDASGGNFSVTLPTAVGVGGQKIGVISVSTGQITINTTSAQTVNGTASAVQIINSAYEFLELVSDGANWLFFRTMFTPSMVRLHTGNGFGATSTKIRAFATTVTNTGPHMTYATTANLAATFTLNKTGYYGMSYTDEGDTGAPAMGFSLNSAQLTTSISAITAADRLVSKNFGTGNERGSVAWSGLLTKGDVIRAHTNSGDAAFISAAVNVNFTIAGPF